MSLHVLFPDRRFGAFLFDMDGTLISSIAVTERIWGDWARSHGLDVPAFLATIHGVRAVENIRRTGLAVDAEAEAARITALELDDMDGVAPIPGIAEFLAALPPERWAVVTSATRLLAERRLRAAGLPVPAVLVSAEDVARGKPAPDCFLLAAARLGQPIGDCLVFEDAPAGIAAAEAAGAAVAVITATHAHPVETRHPPLAHYHGLLAGGLPLLDRAAAA